MYFAHSAPWSLVTSTPRLLTAALIALWPCAASATPDTAALERNRVIATRVFTEIFNERRFSAADELYAPEFVNHGLHRNASLQEDQAAAQSEVKAFPDLKMTVDLMVAVMWTFRGTHTAFGYGFPPTGTPVVLRGMTIWRIRDGKITDEWTTFNSLSVYLQVIRHLKWWLLGLLTIFGCLVWLLARYRRRRMTAPTDAKRQHPPRSIGVA
jgi:predicted ester cyclase